MSYIPKRRPALSGTAGPQISVEVMTTTTAADFDAKRIPGTCKPRSFAVLSLVQEFQRQLNRVAHQRTPNLSKIEVDGDIGPGTLKLLDQVQRVSNGRVMGTATSCINVAADVDVLMPQVRDYANSLGAPARVPDPVSLKTPTIVAPDGSLKAAPGAGIFASVGALPTPHKFVLAASVGGIIYVIATSKRRRRS